MFLHTSARQMLSGTGSHAITSREHSASVDQRMSVSNARREHWASHSRDVRVEKKVVTTLKRPVWI